MDKRVYLLTIVSFVVGMVELIIGGILDLVATDLNVSLGQAGLLITIFSLTFAISAPILSFLTAKIERKKLTLITLFIFFFGNLVAVFSPSYTILFISRMISAASSSLLIVLCVVMAANIVEHKYRGRAIGIVNMGVSGSLVLGVPIGLMLGNAFGWRAPFAMIAVLSLLSITGIFLFMSKMAPTEQISIRKQLGSLKNVVVLFAQSTTFIMLTGHTVLYAYLTPFVKSTMDLDGTWVSIIYFVFGIAAVSGGFIGGTFSDRFGAKPTILSVVLLFGIAIFIIPYTTFSIPLFIIIMVVWGMMSWALTPPMQSYLMQAAPETSNIQISLNNSSVHLGIAFGSSVGGIVIEQASVKQNPTVGGLFVIVALITALISITAYKKRKRKAQH
ncbi:MFS transporter [Oceanobacillus chungangensis]|uniref:MFS transporter n=1 Tax=Oceanobacillus chungangensis TaxID=1229152 RepID=A0A3D8PYL1_9BACI|nr:MFS transporter [Oceanobacillus chungangensis]RDW21246.1 MFS transporter [Oceanobacillus chungangensis]